MKKANNHNNYSPLRYPGGKACLSNFLSRLAITNDLNGGSYCELYAGGAGAALSLLFNETFRRIHINDADYSIYAFWYSILNHTDEFINKIHVTDISVREQQLQKEVYRKGKSNNIVDLGFSTFYLNRTNRSGIIHKAGPIGGLNQTGNYKIDVRFNKVDLAKRIQNLAKLKDRIVLTNEDAVNIINNLERYYPDTRDLFMYLDPPYYQKGQRLYLNNYAHLDHLTLSKAVANLQDIRWLISYDNAAAIRDMYIKSRMSTFDLKYSLQSKKSTNELLIFSDNLNIPDEIEVNRRTNKLILMG